jgi:outer membrane lipase/esterase
MTRFTRIAASVLGAVALASCGGGGDGISVPAPTPTPTFTQMVTFGDSLSDVGTYKVGSIAALGGGQFTVNAATSKNWTELIAAKLSLPAPCAAQTGFSPLIPGFAGAATVNNTACRNYAQGSARVTSPFGPNSKAVQDFVFNANGGAAAGAAAVTAAATASPLGFTALPVVNQINNHLAAAGGSFGDKDLVFVLAGGNDVFLNLGGVGPAAAGGPGAGAAAILAGWTPAQQQAVAAGGAAAVSAAQAAAVQGMTRAGEELAGYVKTLIVARGAKSVGVVTLPDVAQTPLAAGFDAATRGFVNLLATSFNNALQAGLANVPGVVIIDAYAQGRAQVATPAAFGLTNVTDRACSTTSAANPLGGASITCTTASTIAVDTSRYNFADDVHLTPYGNQLLADFVLGRVIAGIK